MHISKEQVLTTAAAVKAHRAFLPTVVVGTAVVSGGLGYILGKRRVNDELLELLNDFLDEEFEELREIEKVLEEEELEELPQPGPVVISESAYEVELAVPVYPEWELDDDAEIAIEEEEIESGEHQVNIFEGQLTSWDHEAELSSRDPDKPYVISVDEYVANESGFPQSTVVYYVGDDILADENDDPIYGYPQMFGILMFGHGSGDPSSVYIRNERLELEWEVLRHESSFEIEVLGYQVEDLYEHQDEIRPANQKFREE